MEGVLRYATILLEASHVPATLATLLVLMQDHVWVCEHNLQIRNGGHGQILSYVLSKMIVCIL